jgi:hypothetical protein
MSFNSMFVPKPDADQRRRATEFHRAKELKARKLKRTAADEKHRAATAEREVARMRRLSRIPAVPYSLIDRDPSERS